MRLSRASGWLVALLAIALAPDVARPDPEPKLGGRRASPVAARPAASDATEALAALPVPSAGERLLDLPDARELGPNDLAHRPGRFGFPPGERFDYRIRYLGIPVAKGWIEVARYLEHDGRRLAHLVAGGETNAFFSLFYRIDDRTEAWVDIDELVTVRTRTHTRHGRKEVWEEVVFDWDMHWVRVWEERRHRELVHEVAFDFGPFTYDTFDIFYAIRSFDLAPGLSVRMPVYASHKIYGLEVNVTRAEQIDSKVLGPVEAFVLEPVDLVDGHPAEHGEGEIWLTAGARPIPVRLAGWFRSKEQFRVGGVTAELVAYRAKRPGWPDLPPPSGTDRRFEAPTREGRPRWTPSSAVRDARSRAGLVEIDRKRPLPAGR